MGHARSYARAYENMTYEELDNYTKNFILPEYRKKNLNLSENENNSKFSIKMNNLRFIVPELLFNPNIIGIEAGGIHEGILSSINECHKDYKDLLFQNIITNGGNTKIQGFNQRLCNELSSSVDYSFVKGVQIFGQEKNDINGYEEPVIEGMKLFSQDNEVIQDLAITKNEYDEIGFNIVWKTCL